MYDVMLQRSIQLVVVLLVLPVLLGSASANPAQTLITVTTTKPGIVADGQCSLTEAIVNANADAKTAADCPTGSGADVIALAPGATYTLTKANSTTDGETGLPSITSDITINGNSATIQRSSAAGTPDFRIFHVVATGALRLRNVTIANGVARGTSGNGASDGVGGGIYSQGMLTAENSIVRDNTAVGGDGIPEPGYVYNGGDGYGGGIFSIGQLFTNDATTILTNTLISNNHALGGRGNSGGTAWGGGMFCGNNAVLLLTTSMLEGNTATGGNAHEPIITNSGDTAFGGGLLMQSNGMSRFNNVTIRNNRAMGGDSAASANGKPGSGLGGGMYLYILGNEGSMTELRGSLVTNNGAGSGKNGAGLTDSEDGYGGGILIDESSMAIVESHIDGNRAARVGGGIALLHGGTADVTRSTISQNNAKDGGGVFTEDGALYLANSTVSGNTAVRGGGIMNAPQQGQTASTFAWNATIANNEGYGSGGGIVNDAAAAQQARTFLWNSMIANNAGGDCSQQNGSITSAGHNLASDGSCSLDAAMGDLPRADPRLGSLQDNGGPTWTHALLPGSPAIDRGNPDGCWRDDTQEFITVDQRGAARPHGAACDIGAYEAGAALVTPKPYRVLLPLMRK